MNSYASYEYYRNEYIGESISQSDFPFFSGMASQYIDAATMRRAKKATGAILDAVKNAVCAIAEIMQDEKNMNSTAFSKEAPLTSETVGSWSKSYGTRSVSGIEIDLISARKKEALLIYLGWTGLLGTKGYYAKRCRP